MLARNTFRGLIAATIVLGLAACAGMRCSPPGPPPGQPMPGPGFGPGGPGPGPGLHRPPPDPALREAFVACASELGLPPPPAAKDAAKSGAQDAGANDATAAAPQPRPHPPMLDPAQHERMEACLAQKGVRRPPGPPPPPEGRPSAD